MSIGHRKTWAKKKIIFMHGNGCEVSPDCLNCPLPDCKWENGNISRRKKTEVELNG